MPLDLRRVKAEPRVPVCWILSGSFDTRSRRHTVFDGVGEQAFYHHAPTEEPVIAINAMGGLGTSRNIMTYAPSSFSYR